MCWIHFSVSVLCIGAGSSIPAETRCPCIIGAGAGVSGLWEWVGTGSSSDVGIVGGVDVTLFFPRVDCGLLSHGVLLLSFGAAFWVVIEGKLALSPMLGGGALFLGGRAGDGWPVWVFFCLSFG